MPSSQPNPTLLNNANPPAWSAWAAQLDRWGLSGPVAALLAAGGALNALAAQALYLGQPLLAPWWANESLTELAATLEDPRQSQAFAAFLQEEAR